MHPLEFAKIALQDWQVGALTISSRYVIKRVLELVGSGRRYIVEYGAGEGALTRALLHSLPEDGKLVAVERNLNFVSELKKIPDPRLSIIWGDVVDVVQDLEQLALPRCDAIISNIPLSFLSPALRLVLLERSWNLLAPGGILTVYQYTPLVLPILRQLSGNVRVTFESRNLPPYFIMVASR